MKQSKELKICRSFIKASTLIGHKRRKVRKKNLKRRDKVFKRIIQRFGSLPIVPEWKQRTRRPL